MDDIDIIYHCAALVSFDPKEKHNVLKTNSKGTANIVDAALEKGIKKFCYISSISTLENKNSKKLTTENHFKDSTDNSSIYSISKQNAETEVWRGAAEGLDVIVLNPSVIIGGGNWQQSSANMFNKAYKGLKFYTDGATGFVDVRDVVKKAIALMDSDIVNEQFILNSQNVTYKQFFELIHTEFGKSNPSIKAGTFLSSFAWRVEKIKSFITGEAPLITKETAKSAHNVGQYSNSKILEFFPDFKFISIDQSIKDTCKLYLKDN
jgi:nucleoside-diphosphate-sugar epimerase